MAPPKPRKKAKMFAAYARMGDARVEWNWALAQGGNGLQEYKILTEATEAFTAEGGSHPCVAAFAGVQAVLVKINGPVSPSKEDRHQLEAVVAGFNLANAAYQEACKRPHIAT